MTPTAKAEIDQLLSGAVTNKAVIPGVVAMVATDGGIVYQGAFGKRDVQTGTDMALDSVFWLASMTKATTATAAMQLVDQGKWTLFSSFERLLPELPELWAPKVLMGFDSEGKPRLREATIPIDLGYLLTHRAGFAYDIWNPNMARYIKYAKVPPIVSCKNDALKTPLVSEPGSGWHYGTSIDFVGKVVEKVSGQSLEVYFREHIFKPLGMKDTSFILRPDQLNRLVKVHTRGPNGSVVPTDFLMPQNPEFFMGGGGLYGTAGDYLAFLQMLMHGGTFTGAQIIRPQWVKRMSENGIENLSVPAIWKTADPSSSLDVDLAKMFPGQDLKWGMSFLINTQPVAGGRSAGSLTWAGLANTFYWLDPTKRVAGVILTQSLPFWDPGVIGVYSQFEKLVYKALAAA